eukprot:TRINITY_DN29706_c0_g1_i1.p1 TRINITY_DN29706_c0_g1~~TRINITY_DN29706_c0_g1_i1.p1  ORF type:complete len:518 (+),score=67.24 TRINITY_DN29706_c0_g1_i1:84-1637(+)
MPRPSACGDDSDASVDDSHRRLCKLADVRGEDTGGSTSGAGESREEVLQGVVGVLQQAQQALLRLGVPPVQGNGIRGNENNSQAASSGLEGLVASLQAVLVPATEVAGKAPLMKPSSTRLGGARDGNRRGGNDRNEGEIEEFVSSHNLDSWVGEVLSMLSPSQRSSVIDPPLNVERARNPSGVVVSRIKQVTSVQHRMQMFIKVNDLAEGVIDRISTLTDEQCDAVMANGMMIQKANNPSGVAMKRISEAIRNNPSRPRRTGNLAIADVRGRQLRASGSRRQFDHRDPGGLFANVQDNSRSPSVRRHYQRALSNRSHSGGGDDGEWNSCWPADVKNMVEDLGLENWCGEVLRRLSLFQRQAVNRANGEMRGVRNPSGVVMSHVKNVASNEELTTIFIDLNGLDKSVADKLWSLTPEQRSAVIAPGIYVQNVRNPANVVRSRITRVEGGHPAVEGGARNHQNRVGGGAGGASGYRGGRYRRRRCPSSDGDDGRSSGDEPSRSRSRSSRRPRRGRRRFR